MSNKKQALRAGAVALAVALAAIVGAAYVLPSNLQPNPSPAGTGTLSILLTDPPTIPAGVTGVFATYSNVAVHVSGAGNQSGWQEVNTAGTLNLLKMVNVSTTIASVSVKTGVYDALRFNISAAEVTFDGKNYTAFIPKAMISVSIPGGVSVATSKSSAAIIDLHPTILNIGSRSTPEFIVNAAANVFNIPSDQVTDQMKDHGFMMPIGDAPWWMHINEQYTANLQVAGAVLQSNSYSVTLKNTGTSTVSIGSLILTPVGNPCDPQQQSSSTSTSTTTTSSTTSGTSTTTAKATSSTSSQSKGGRGNFQPPSCLSGSATFIVDNNGTVLSVSSLLQVPPNHESHGSQPPAPLAGGYQLAAGQSVTLKYSGAVTFGIAFRGATPPGVVAGDQYDITAVGQQALAQYVVTAS